MSQEKQDFVGYEYKEETINRSMESAFIDGYLNFGWELVESVPSTPGTNKVTMRFKRNRKIRNKGELSRLQRQFENLIREITSLEFSKGTKASTFAYIIGVIGTAFMAGSVFAVTAGMTALCIILAIPGFIGWIIPYWVFRNLRQRKSNEVNPIIEQKYDAIYATCEKANLLLEN